ncbi:MAG: carboxypeptidase-like regulatory domain-containing protein, partial [Bacteroidales bacterium]|nr:carboxypeptidase-like regulatory domain-containing protein [Bacteroidales bacterium]
MDLPKNFGKQINFIKGYQWVTIIAMFMMLVFAGCKPEQNYEEKEINISVQLSSSLEEKQIADGTEITLSDGKSTFTAYSENQTTAFAYPIINNQSIDFELIAKENTGHTQSTHSFSANADKTIQISMDAKTWTVPVSIQTTKEENPVANIAYQVNPGNITGNTDESGIAVITFRLSTDTYNQAIHTAANFTFLTSPATKQMTYDRSISATETNSFLFDLAKQSYQHTFNVTVSSNIDEKTPLLDTASGKVTVGQNNYEFNPQTGEINFVSDNQTENNIEISIENVPGFENGNLLVNNQGEELKNGTVYNITLEAKTYNTEFETKVTDGTIPIQGASVNGEFETIPGVTQTTNENGITTFTFTVPTTENNLLKDSYTFKTTTNKSGYPETINTIVFNDQNPLQILPNTYKQIVINLTADEYWLTGTVTPENNVSVTGWEGGSQVLTTTVANGTYTTPKLNEEPTNGLDSVVFESTVAGYENKVFKNVALTKNSATTLNAVLDAIANQDKYAIIWHKAVQDNSISQSGTTFDV